MPAPSGVFGRIDGIPLPKPVPLGAALTRPKPAPCRTQ